MSNIVQKLTKLASDLDSVGMTKSAAAVDKVAANTLEIKVAQYVGIQGYWMRNRRCWENCYRQKRSRNKKMPAQTVWTECHQEYIEALNDDHADWNKYAKEESTIKVSSEDGKKMLAAQVEIFNKRVDQRVKSNEPLGYAIFASIDEMLNLSSGLALRDAEKLSKISTYLKDKGQEKLASELAQCSAQLVKEAQLGMWEKAKGQLGRLGLPAWMPGGSGGKSKAQSMLDQLQNQLTNIGIAAQQGYHTRDPRAIKRYNDLINKFIQGSPATINYLQKEFGDTPGMNAVIDGIQQLSIASPGRQRQQALTELYNSINQFRSDAVQQQSLEQPKQSPASPVAGQDDAAAALGEMAGQSDATVSPEAQPVIEPSGSGETYEVSQPASPAAQPASQKPSGVQEQVVTGPPSQTGEWTGSPQVEWGQWTGLPQPLPQQSQPAQQAPGVQRGREQGWQQVAPGRKRKVYPRSASEILKTIKTAQVSEDEAAGYISGEFDARAIERDPQNAMRIALETPATRDMMFRVFERAGYQMMPRGYFQQMVQDYRGVAARGDSWIKVAYDPQMEQQIDQWYQENQPQPQFERPEPNLAEWAATAPREYLVTMFRAFGDNVQALVDAANSVSPDQDFIFVHQAPLGRYEQEQEQQTSQLTTEESEALSRLMRAKIGRSKQVALEKLISQGKTSLSPDEIAELAKLHRAKISRAQRQALSRMGIEPAHAMAFSADDIKIGSDIVERLKKGF